jgi:hypothetical protein
VQQSWSVRPPSPRVVVRLPTRVSEDSDLVCRSWAPHPASVGAARGVVAATVRAWRMPFLLDAAVLVTSELVTNAVVHARSPFTLTLQEFPGAVLVRVNDDSSELPARPPLDLEDLHGRGLRVVDRLCLQWGSIVLGSSGKAVWALLDGSEADEPIGHRG